MIIDSNGPKECLMAIVCESPEGNENILNTKLHINGIGRQQCYVTYLSKESPARWHSRHKGIYNEVRYKKPARIDDFSIYWNGTTPSQYLLDCRDTLLQELTQLKTNVILACGDSVLWALTGNKAIAKYRGSILECKLPNNKMIKVIGTWSPNKIFTPLKKVSPGGMAHIIGFDIGKAKIQSEFSEFKIPKRNLIIRPSDKIVTEFILDNQKSDKISYDIETAPGRITCLSLAFNRHEAISIPTESQHWESDQQFLRILNMCNYALTKPNTLKIAQFMNYDYQYLFRFFNIMVKQPWFDTAIAQHACYPELPKGLDFLLSIYTDEPYYKDELKQWMKDTDDLERLWEYNARDACVEFEVAEELEIEMNELKVKHTFNYMMELMEPLLFIMLHGMRFDKKVADMHREYYTIKLARDEAVIREKYGDVNPRSPKQVLALLEKLKIKPPMKKGKPSTDKKSMEKLAIKNPELNSIIGVRKSGKFISNYIDVGLDPIDERFRFSMNQTRAVTGRLSSSESSFWGVGCNSENIPKSVRNMFIPDPGLVFTNADLKGAEAVVVAYLSEDPLLMKLFEEGSIEPEPGFKFTNVHCLTAYLIWHQTEQAIKEEKKRLGAIGKDTESMYFKGKKTRHSGNYKGTWVTLSAELKISAAEAKSLLRKFMGMSPNIQKWHQEVEMQLKSTRVITTSLGRKRTFFDIWSPDLMRAAVAYEPQETVVHVLNIGLIRVYNKLCKVFNKVSLLNQVHDSLLLQHPPELTPYIHKELHKLMNVPLTIKGRTFSIPIEIESSSLTPVVEEGWYQTGDEKWEWGRLKNINNWRDMEEV